METNARNFKEPKVSHFFPGVSFLSSGLPTAIEQEKADKSKVSENALRERIIELDKLFTAQREKLYNVTTEMNKQYKTLQDALLGDINELKSEVKKQTDEIGFYFLSAQLSIEILFRAKGSTNQGNDDRS